MNNIKHIRKMKKMTQSDISKLTGISRVQIMRLENGTRRLNQDHINKISQALHCKPEDIISDIYLQKITCQDIPEAEDINNVATIPFYNQKEIMHVYTNLREKNSIPLKEINIDKNLLNNFTTSNPSNLISLQYFGRSMYPKIENTDFVVIDISQNKIKEDTIYAFIYDNEFFISSIQKLPNRYKIIPYNSIYDTWYIECDHQIKLKVLGTIIAKIAKI